MKKSITSLFLFSVMITNAQKIPLVFSKENSGIPSPKLVLPALEALPEIAPLTDPFQWSNSNSRSTKYEDWAKRRNEIKAEIEGYEIGFKPPRPENLIADFNEKDSLLTISVTENGKSLKIMAKVWLPKNGKGPYPVIIGMNRPNGSLPMDIFTSRNIAMIAFMHNQVTVNGNPQTTDPYYTIYPELNPDNTGQYSAWAWGVSRIIDGLELTQGKLPIDLKHIGVTGCSYAGKMALISGAFDERIALTIAQESGGGGATAWRVSETLGAVEKLGATSHAWFKEGMFDYANDNVVKLPYDHHELMAMVAPRALLVTGNTDYTWLANPSNYITSRATQEVYKAFGIADRFGFYIDGKHGHCQIPETQKPAIEAFVDKFLLGKDVNTDIAVNPYPEIDYKRWTSWWGTRSATFPAEKASTNIWLEAECGNVGADWVKEQDAQGNVIYLVPRADFVLPNNNAPAQASSYIQIAFEIETEGYYSIQARVNCATSTSDGFSVKIDEGGTENANSLLTKGWEWKRLLFPYLSKGKHQLTIAIREKGAKIDKLRITNSNFVISGPGDNGQNCK